MAVSLGIYGKAGGAVLVRKVHSSGTAGRVVVCNLSGYSSDDPSD